MRIEDTDRSRHVEGALDNLMEIFAWLGIEFNEGPGIGGDVGPYVQSQRLDVYRRHVERLLAEGSAYRCFCSPERLNEVRRAHQKAGRLAMYDRLCRRLDPEESRRRAEYEIFVIRLKMPLTGEIEFIDSIRGKLSFKSADIDDQVLLKSDGYPTYHLANVVDDHLMGITDVIRGEEWLTSTPKHIHLYRCFDWESPGFHHLPLLLNPDRSKLSKRQGDVAVEDYRRKGYLPVALLNYTALLGWHPADDREVFSLEELEREFSLERVGKAAAVFDLDKLKWLNRQHMKSLSDEDFIRLTLDYIPSGIDFNGTIGEKLLRLLRERIDSFGDIPQQFKPFTGNRELPETGEVFDAINNDETLELMRSILAHVDDSDEWSSDTFKTLIKTAGKEAGLKGKKLWMPVRVALTGEVHGPELAIIAEVIGRRKFRALIEETAESLESTM